MLNIIYVKTPDMWNGEDTSSAEYFEYVIDGISFYIPASQYVVKIADFGESTKYNHPMIITNNIVVKNVYNYTYEYIPNFYSAAYDVGFALFRMFSWNRGQIRNKVLILCLHYFVGGFRSEEFQNLLHEVENDLFDVKVYQWLEDRYKPKSRNEMNVLLSKFFDEDMETPIIDTLEEFPLNIMTAASILKSDIFKGYRERPEGRIVRVGTC